MDDDIHCIGPPPRCSDCGNYGSNDDCECEKIRLQKFKDYVHKRLDDAGVPINPESSHKDKGCRIGGRLDWVLSRLISETT